MKMGTADFSRLLSKQPTSTWHHPPIAHHASFNHQKINMSWQWSFIYCYYTMYFQPSEESKRSVKFITAFNPD